VGGVGLSASCAWCLGLEVKLGCALARAHIPLPAQAAARTPPRLVHSLTTHNPPTPIPIPHDPLLPRIAQMVKVEEGLCEGKVLYHSHIAKTPGEAAAQQAQHESKNALRAQRKQQQVRACPASTPLCGGVGRSKGGRQSCLSFLVRDEECSWRRMREGPVSTCAFAAFIACREKTAKQLRLGPAVACGRVGIAAANGWELAQSCPKYDHSAGVQRAAQEAGGSPEGSKQGGEPLLSRELYSPQWLTLHGRIREVQTYVAGQLGQVKRSCFKSLQGNVNAYRHTHTHTCARAHTHAHARTHTHTRSNTHSHTHAGG